MNYAARLSENQFAIFLLHGVVRESNYQVRNYTRKHLTQDYFRRFLLELKQSGTPLSLDDFIRFRESGEKIPPRAFAITFDDGFENNFSVAAPVLADLQIPATFYVTTGFIAENEMSWIDRIEYCLERAKAASLRLPWRPEAVSFRTPQEKIAILDEIRYHVKRDETISREELIESIFRDCGVSSVRQTDDPLDLKMSWKQVSALHDDRLFTVGGHTHRHSILSFLSPQELREEITLSIRLLDERAGIRSHHYSYPEGLRHCYNDQVIEVLRGHGITCCPTAEDGVNPFDESLFHLKRINVV